MRRLTESGINSVTYSKKLCVCPLLRGYQSGCEKAPEQLWPKMEMETTQPVEKGKGKGKREREWQIGSREGYDQDSPDPGKRRAIWSKYKGG